MLRRLRSFQTLLSTTLALLVIIPLAFTAAFTYIRAQGALSTEQRASNDRTVGLMSHLIDQRVKSASSALDAAAMDYQVEKVAWRPTVSEAFVTTNYATRHKTNADLVSLYLAMTDGNIVAAPKALPATYNAKTQDWYQKALQSPSGDVVGSPGVDPFGNLVVPVASVVRNVDGSPAGVLVANVLADPWDLAVTSSAGSGQVAFALTEQGAVLDGIKPGPLQPADIASVAKSTVSQGSGYLTVNAKGVTYNGSFLKDPSTGWHIVLLTSNADIASLTNGLLWSMIVLLVVFAVIALAAGLYGSRLIGRPVVDLMEKMKRAESGDLAVRVHYSFPEEMARLGNSFNNMMENIADSMRAVTETAQWLGETAGQLTNRADETTRASEDVAAAIAEVASGMELQVEHVNSTADAMDAIREGAQEIERRAGDALDAAGTSAQLSSRGVETMRTAVEQMNAIADASAQVSEKVFALNGHSLQVGQVATFINAIADQTNLLSLNAAIEAARAGEAGRGFAVVATEVRKLSEQAREATGQITQTVRQMQGDIEAVVGAMSLGQSSVERGVTSIQTAQEDFSQINEAILRVQSQMADVTTLVARLTTEQEEVATSVASIVGIAESAAGNAQSVSAVTEQTVASMGEVAASARRLSESADNLKAMVTRFTLAHEREVPELVSEDIAGGEDEPIDSEQGPEVEPVTVTETEA